MIENDAKGAKRDPEIIDVSICLRKGDFNKLLALLLGIHSILRIEGPHSRTIFETQKRNKDANKTCTRSIQLADIG